MPASIAPPFAEMTLKVERIAVQHGIPHRNLVLMERGDLVTAYYDPESGFLLAEYDSHRDTEVAEARNTHRG